MMLTKEECEKAYTDLEISLTVLKRAIEGNEELINPVGIFNRALVTFARLIHEHFSNPPLEFEELKEGMWIWDKEEEEWVWLCMAWKENDKELLKVHSIYEYDSVCKFEPNRFYRKEVQDV